MHALPFVTLPNLRRSYGQQEHAARRTQNTLANAKELDEVLADRGAHKLAMEFRDTVHLATAYEGLLLVHSAMNQRQTYR